MNYLSQCLLINSLSGATTTNTIVARLITSRMMPHTLRIKIERVPFGGKQDDGRESRQQVACRDRGERHRDLSELSKVRERRPTLVTSFIKSATTIMKAKWRMLTR